MKIFLAGTNAEQKNAETLKEAPYLLESFYYVREWQLPILKNCKEFLLDSGAYTFLNNSKKDVDWDEYIEKYAEFINKHEISLFFELDIDSIVGHDKVKEYRNRLERKTNRRSIPVWHKSRGYDEYLRLADEYDYIAIGGIAIKEIKRSEYRFFPRMLSDAHKRRCRVHGLGFTNTTLLPLYHFDSVDSTRWNCARFGRLERFDGKTIVAIDRSKEGKRLCGRSKGQDIIKYTLSEWIKFQKYAEVNL